MALAEMSTGEWYEDEKQTREMRLSKCRFTALDTVNNELWGMFLGSVNQHTKQYPLYAHAHGILVLEARIQAARWQWQCEWS